MSDSRHDSQLPMVFTGRRGAVVVRGVQVGWARVGPDRWEFEACPDAPEDDADLARRTLFGLPTLRTVVRLVLEDVALGRPRILIDFEHDG